jgi:hypothetical protein
VDDIQVLIASMDCVGLAELVDEHIRMQISNTAILPVECLENDYPLIVEKYEMVKDSGGPGKWCGGMGIHRRVRLIEGEVDFITGGARQKVPPWDYLYRDPKERDSSLEIRGLIEEKISTESA